MSELVAKDVTPMITREQSTGVAMCAFISRGPCASPVMVTTFASSIPKASITHVSNVLTLV